jgi:hypothetical protein
VQRLYLEPNNGLSVYRNTPIMNLTPPPADSTQTVRIEVADLSGNTSVLEFKLINAGGQRLSYDEPNNLPFFRFKQPNFYMKDDLSISMPRGALYRDMYFEHELKPACDDCLSPVHAVSSSRIPVHRYYDISIALGQLPAGIEKAKLCLVSLKEGRIIDYEGGNFNQGYVKTRTRQFGDFAVSFDTTAPVARALDLRDGQRLQKGQKLRWKVSDDLSGLEHYDAYLNQTWVRLYYDAKNDLITLQTDDLPRLEGEQQLKLRVEDAKQNVNELFYQVVL